MPRSVTASLQRDGFVMLRELVTQAQLDAWNLGLEAMLSSQSAGPHASRNLLASAKLRELAGARNLLDVVEQMIGSSAWAVRGILFNKVPGANWRVTWHQDLSIAVQRKLAAEGYGPWSVKQGVVHVQPPMHVLQEMVTLRIHLDDCFKDNGPLRVIPGSHDKGMLDAATIEAARLRGPIHDCEAARGDVLAMRPLLLHASSPATSPGSRRVVHLEYAAHELPDGLAWHDWSTA